MARCWYCGASDKDSPLHTFPIEDGYVVLLCGDHYDRLLAASDGSLDVFLINTLVHFDFLNDYYLVADAEEVSGANYETVDSYVSRESTRGITEIENMLRGISNG